MTVGAWTPDSATIEAGGKHIPAELIDGLLAAKLDDIAAAFNETDAQKFAPWMRVTADEWKTAAEPLNAEQILHLIKAITLAEETFAGWECGDKSPAIALNKYYRKLGHKLAKEDLLWIRENSSNRFIPNGAL
jgi:hypothetical protein